MPSAFEEYDRHRRNSNTSSLLDDDENKKRAERPEALGHEIANHIDWRTHIVSPIFLVCSAVFIIFIGSDLAALQQWWWFPTLFLCLVLVTYPVMRIMAHMDWSHRVSRAKKKQKKGKRGKKAEMPQPFRKEWATKPHPALLPGALVAVGGFIASFVGHLIGPAMLWVMPLTKGLDTQIWLLLVNGGLIGALLVLISRGMRDARPWHFVCLVVGVIAVLGVALFMGVFSYSAFYDTAYPAPAPTST